MKGFERVLWIGTLIMCLVSLVFYIGYVFGVKFAVYGSLPVGNCLATIAIGLLVIVSLYSLIVGRRRQR